MDRRDFMRIVTSVYASNTLLATMTTSAQVRKVVIKGNLASVLEGGETGPKTDLTGEDSEKVELSNNGANLVLDISGRPRRCVAVLYKLRDRKGVEHTFIHQIARIKKPKVVSIAVDMAQGLDTDIPFMVVTSNTPRFSSDNRGTDWFTVRISSTQPISGNLPQNYATDPSGEHQKVVMYGLGQIQRRFFAPLKSL